MGTLRNLFTVLLLLAALQTAEAEQSVTLGEVIGQDTSGTIWSDYDVTFIMRTTNNGTPECTYNPIFSFRVYSDDEAAWNVTSLEPAIVQIDTISFIPGVELITDTLWFEELFTTMFEIYPDNDGFARDSVSIAYLNFGDKPGLYEGFDGNSVAIRIHPELSSIGKHICIDTVSIGPGYEWLWGGAGPGCDYIVPDWGGPYCFEIGDPPSLQFMDPTPSYAISNYCRPFSARFYAVDIASGEDVQYSIVSGPGVIDPFSGDWTWETVTFNDVGTHIELIVEACTATECVQHAVDVIVTNDGTVFTTGCDSVYAAWPESEVVVNFSATSACETGGELIYTIIDDGGAMGLYYLEGSSLHYFPETGDAAAGMWQINVTDGVNSDVCDFGFDVITEYEKSVVLDDVIGSRPDSLIRAGEEIEFLLRIRNFNTPNCLFMPGMAYEISSEDGAEWEYTILETANVGRSVFVPDRDTVFFEELFDAAFIDAASDDGQLADSVTFVGISLGHVPGVYEGLDRVCQIVKIRPTVASDGKQICLDRIMDFPAYEWKWHGMKTETSSSCSESLVIPDWGGPYCFTVDNTPPGPIEFAPGIPDTIVAGHCEEVDAKFSAMDPVWNAPITFSVLEGPGQIDAISGEWNWVDATIGDMGQYIALTIEACANEVCAQKTIHIRLTNEAPEFETGCDTTYLVAPDSTSFIAFESLDNCVADPAAFFVAENSGVEGAFSFDGNILTYTPAENDTAAGAWTIGVTDGVDTSYCSIDFSFGCCGLYTGGTRGNTNCSPDGKITLTDITTMIDHVYVSKSPLCCRESANMNGDPEVTISLSDIVALIDHVYISHSAASPCP